MKTSQFYLSFILFLLLSASGLICQDYVYIYDDISDGGYGRSTNRSVIRGVRLDRFSQFRTLTVETDLLESNLIKGFLTPLVFSAAKKSDMDRGVYTSISLTGSVYRYRGEGIDISFTLEKPDSGLLAEIDQYYKDWPQWHEPVKNHYLDNWVIRILEAENVFEPWIDLITYNEALLSASLIADRDQWMWGVRDGADILLK
jgi:hypothetical protein